MADILWTRNPDTGAYHGAPVDGLTITIQRTSPRGPWNTIMAGCDVGTLPTLAAAKEDAANVAAILVTSPMHATAFKVVDQVAYDAFRQRFAPAPKPEAVVPGDAALLQVGIVEVAAPHPGALAGTDVDGNPVSGQTIRDVIAGSGFTLGQVSRFAASDPASPEGDRSVVMLHVGNQTVGAFDPAVLDERFEKAVDDYAAATGMSRDAVRARALEIVDSQINESIYGKGPGGPEPVGFLNVDAMTAAKELHTEYRRSAPPHRKRGDGRSSAHMVGQKAFDKAQRRRELEKKGRKAARRGRRR
jgi:hypothetical protein